MEEQDKTQQTPQTPAGVPEERKEQDQDFQTLIQGKYREDYLQALGQALSAQARETRRYLAYRELQHRLEGVKARYPDFDLDREAENPEFLRLVENAVDPKTAYEVVHHGDLVREAECLAKNAARPVENGLAVGSQATVYRADPKALTRQERRQLRRRAARGEEIIW